MHDFQEAVKVRLGCVPTSTWQSRGSHKVQTKCKCANVRVSLGHMAQPCPTMHGFWIKWHDKILDYLSHCWKAWGLTVLKEPRFEISAGLQKLDLLVHKADNAIVVDEEIRTDCSIGSEDAPVCPSCKVQLTTKHILLNCNNLKHIRTKYYQARNLRDIFKNTNPENIFNFLKESNFFSKI